MSISNLIDGPNHYNLFVNSVFVEESFSVIPVNASQVLSTVAPTQLLIDQIVISPQFNNGQLVLSPTSYTCPSTGVYHFGGSVQIVYGVTAADFVSQTVQIIANGATIKFQASDERTCAAGSGASVNLPLNCYIFLTKGDVITIQMDTPSSNVGAGNFTTNNMTKGGTMWYGNRG